MTIQSSTSRATYAGDNVSTIFPVPFLFFANIDVGVVKTTAVGGITTLTLNVDYTLTGAGVAAGGTLVKTTALLTGETLGIFLDPPRTQLSHYLTNDPFPASTLENNIDRGVQISQRLYDLINRSIRAPDSDNNPQLTLPSAVSRALKYVTFDSGGNLSMAVSLPSGTLSAASIGGFLNPQTTAEAAANITPVNLAFQAASTTPADAVRYNSNQVLRTAADLLAVFGNPRTKPAGFSFVTGNIFGCAGPGVASHDFDAEQEFLSTYASQAGSIEYYVDFNNGNDANVGSLNAPFKTIRGCFQNAAGLGIVWLMPGVYATPFDVRGIDNTISGGTLARAVRIKAMGGPGTVTFRDPGDQPGVMSWVLTPATAEYEATPSGLEIAYHIIFHEDNREIQLQWYSSAANVNAQVSGWYQDPATKKIYVRHRNIDFSIPGNAAHLEIMYGSASGSIVYGAKVYLDGITLRGGNELDITYGDGFRPVCYARNCKFQYRAYHSIRASGGITLFQDCTSEYSLGGDGWNYTKDTPTSTESQGIEVDCVGRYNGVPQYSQFDGVRNKQGSSCHDSTVIMRVNGQYYGNYGQSIADTGVGSTSWMVGTICGNPYSDLASGGIGGYYSLWTEGSAYLDSVRAGGRASTYGLWVETGTARMYRCELRGSTSPIGVNTGVTGIYNPTA